MTTTNSTNYVNLQTVISAAWANDINNAIYNTFTNLELFATSTTPVDPTGVTDSASAIRAAITYITTLPTTNGGGVLYVGPGLYALSPAVGDTTNTAVTIPSGVRIVGAGQIATTFIPGTASTNLFRIIGSNGGLSDCSFTNPNSFTGCHAIRLAPPNESDTTTLSTINWNRLSNISIIGPYDEALTLRPGPRVSGTDSELYYNTFTNFDIRGTTRGVWIKAPPNTAGGANANNFIFVRAGQNGMNTAFQIDQGSENNFTMCAGEGVATGSSPNASPTAIYVATGSGSNTSNNNFDLFRSEGNITSWNLNNNTKTTLNMSADSGLTNGTPGSYTNLSGGIGFASTGAVGVGTSSPAAFHTLDVVLPGNGYGVNITDIGTSSNQHFSYNASAGGGTSSLIEFKHAGTAVVAWGGSATTYAGVMYVQNPTNNPLVLGANGNAYWEVTGGGNFLPVTNASFNIGSAGNQVNNIYLVNNPIVSSDATIKQQVSPIDDRVLRAWSKVNYSQYKLNDAVTKKGPAARTHIGLIAQSIQTAFAAEGLDAFDYGILCKDTIDGIDHLAVRYNEALALECAYLRSQLSPTPKP